MNPTDAHRSKIRVAALSVFSNATLVILKLMAGLLIGSVSIISEAIHSGVDLLAAIIALFSVKMSSIPADRTHPFGHGKIENISGTVEALLIFLAAGWIIYESVLKLINPGHLESLGWGVGVMTVSAVANFVVSEMLFRVGRKTDSIALQADAWHLRTDVYTSAGVMVGLCLIWAGQKVLPGRNLMRIDPVAAIGVALLIIKAAWDLTKEAARDLLDVSLPKEEEEWITGLIVARKPSVHGFHHLRTRKGGHYRFVEFHLMVEPQMTVKVSHEITRHLNQQIREKYPDTSITIHVEPCEGRCEAKCLEGCLLAEDERRLMSGAD